MFKAIERFRTIGSGAGSKENKLRISKSDDPAREGRHLHLIRSFKLGPEYAESRGDLLIIFSPPSSLRCHHRHYKLQSK